MAIGKWCEWLEPLSFGSLVRLFAQLRLLVVGLACKYGYVIVMSPGVMDSPLELF